MSPVPAWILPFLACAAEVSNEDWPVAPAVEIVRTQAGPLPPSIRAEPSGTRGFDVTFALASTTSAATVHLAGSFNGWSTTRTPLSRGADGRWTVTTTLGEGVHSYKFVLDGARWIADPRNDDTASDGHGGSNSVLRLGALGRPGELAAKVGDGEVVASALEHDPRSSLYRQRAASGGVLVRYRTLANDLEAVAVVVRGDGETPMRPVVSSGPFAIWEATLPRSSTPFTYGFLLRDGDLLRTDPRDHLIDPAKMRDLATPDWTKHAIWYQILVDRFRKGSEKDLGQPLRDWTSEWYTPAKWEGKDGQTFYEYFVFQRMYGGDFAGVRERLDYLQELGVNALYFNPIFQAPGHHKYNATDFRHIDTGYGAGEDYLEATRHEDLLDPSTWTWTPSDRVFLDFLKECKRRGMRVVLDGVFNHVGVHHPAFVDVRENGASSRFADWFDVTSWEPFEYSGWAGHGELPVFKKAAHGFASDAVKEHIFAITRRWMDPDGDGDPSDGIDGWRLDVPMEVAMPFWEEWRTLVKSLNPDAYVTGEVWQSAEEWLDGKRFDAVMNYRFADAMVAWIGNVERKLSATELDERLTKLRLAYPAEATSCLMDLLDSHDTDRFASMMKNPDRDYDEGNREQNAGTTYDASRPGKTEYRKLRLAALAQMTYVGAPMIYYGDEVGMYGSDDPNNRKPMLWSDLEPYRERKQNFVDEELLAYYRSVIALRNEHPALRVGDLRTLFTDDDQDLWVFERTLEGETLLVALCARSEKARFELPEGQWGSLFGSTSSDSGRRVTVPAIGGRVWRKEG